MRSCTISSIHLLKVVLPADTKTYGAKETCLAMVLRPIKWKNDLPSNKALRFNLMPPIASNPLYFVKDCNLSINMSIDVLHL